MAPPPDDDSWIASDIKGLQGVYVLKATLIYLLVQKLKFLPARVKPMSLPFSLLVRQNTLGYSLTSHSSN